ncbi:MAG: hypothetical protein GC146_14755 [Limimaricola sp.]|uniref:hypothetical protein n=1 Tax=Limimaricola sp. TaxID=2211665 RepID=UPI001DF5D6E2|nr:hypothetical protein [Limimaricola sp.]MBI1418475.1 hypothetical protein [Limimaricola sp.]
MTRQNRVLATGEIVAHPARGQFMGNRGILHDAAGRITRRWAHKAWICCRLAFKDRHRQIMAPHHYTELFFLDEAVALAAGHRPCAECRRAAFTAFQAAWATATGQRPKAPEIDAALHAARTGPRATASLATLPDATVILWQGQPHLVLGPHLRPIAPDGYGAPLVRPPTATVTLLTPRPIIAALAAGYRPALHPGAA